MATTSMGLPQPIDSLGGGMDLKRLLAGLQQQRQGLPGEAAAAAEPASKRQRSGEVSGLLDGAAASQTVPQPLESLAGTPLGLQLPFLPLHGGMQAVGGLAASHGFGPTAPPACVGMPLPTSQPAPAPGMLPPSVLHALGNTVAGGSTLAPAQAPLNLLQQHPGGTGSGSHSHTGTDSAEGGSGEGRRRGVAARRTPEERLHANKEKNRRAQQRFRLRQKEKMVWLEAELLRLQALCAQHGIDPSPTAPPPVVLRGPPSAPAAPVTALPLPQQPPAALQELTKAPAPALGMQAGMQAATAQAASAPVPQCAGMQPAPGAQPSTEQMYEQLEAMLERCHLVPADTAIAFLAAFQRADAETRRCQFLSLRRRFDASRAQEVASCIAHFLAAGEGVRAGGATPVPIAAAAAAGMPQAAQEQAAVALKASSPRPGSAAA